MSSSMTFRDHNRPDPMLSYSPINLGVFKGHDFDIDPEFVMYIGRDAFHGLESEDVLGHLRTFEYVCGLVKREGVPNETIKLLLFPFCIEDKATKWLYSHPSNTFSSWDDLAQAFLYKYFPPSKTSKFRHDILTFQQGEFEGLSESWERFKGLLSDCPHHGIPSWLTTLTFFQNLLPYHRDLVIIASRGKFDELNAKEACELIERMASADQNWGFERVTPRRGPQVRDDSDIHSLLDDLNKKVDLLLLDNVHRVHSQHVPLFSMNMCGMHDFSSTCDTCGGVGHTSHVCPSHAYSPPPLNLNVRNDVNAMLSSNEHLSHYPSCPISPLKDQLTPQNANLKISSNGSELEFMRFDDNDYDLHDLSCPLVENDLNDMFMNELECVKFYVSLENVKSLSDVVSEETPLVEYEVFDELYDEECVSNFYDALDIEWDENCVLVEIEKPMSCRDNVCEFETCDDSWSGKSVDLEDKWDYEVDFFEEPILEKFEDCLVEDEFFTSIDQLDLISLTPILESMMLDEGHDNLTNEEGLVFDLTLDDYLMEKFENGDTNTSIWENLNEQNGVVHGLKTLDPPLVHLKQSDESWSDYDILGVYTFTKTLLASHVYYWSCLLFWITCDHFLEDWSSTFDKLMRSLTGFLNNPLA